MVLRYRRSMKKCAAEKDDEGTATLMGDPLEIGRGVNDERCDWRVVSRKRIGMHCR